MNEHNATFSTITTTEKQQQQPGQYSGMTNIDPRQQQVMFTPQVANYGYVPESDLFNEEDSMLHLKEHDDEVYGYPSNYAINIGSSTVVQNPYNPAVEQFQPPREGLVGTTPTMNNYINTANNVHQVSQINPSHNGEIESKFKTWSTVVMSFAILLTIFGVFNFALLVFQLIASQFNIDSASPGSVTLDIPVLVVDFLLSSLNLSAGICGILSTKIKDTKKRKWLTIAHIILLW